jgi:hypothetical protein
VNQTDYQFWIDRFGHHTGSGAGASAAMPEPESLRLLLIAGILLAFYTLTLLRSSVVCDILGGATATVSWLLLCDVWAVDRTSS